MKNGLKPLSLKDIARMSNCSAATVSRVINNVPGSMVSKSKREEILKITSKAGYRPNRNARLFSRKSNRCECIGVVIPGSSFYSYRWQGTSSLSMETLQGVSEALSEANQMMTFVISPPEDSEEFLRKEFFNEQRVDGMLIFGGSKELAMASEFREKNMPLVTFDWVNAIENNVPLLVHDPEIAIKEMVCNIAENGHKYIGLIHQPKAQSVPSERLSLFEKYCNEYGLALQYKKCISRSDEYEASAATIELVKQDRKISCVFYSSDNLAIIGIRALMSMGLSVPDDISVTGFDDAPYTIHSPVPLSTVRVPRKKMGKAAVRLLLDLVKGGESPTRLTFPCEWIKRKSLGKAKNK